MQVEFCINNYYTFKLIPLTLLYYCGDFRLMKATVHRKTPFYFFKLDNNT